VQGRVALQKGFIDFVVGVSLLSASLPGPSSDALQLPSVRPAPIIPRLFRSFHSLATFIAGGSSRGGWESDGARRAQGGLGR
jgi:hypothetical protein